MTTSQAQLQKLRDEVEAAERKWRVSRGQEGGKANHRAWVKVKACLCAAEVDA